MLDKNRRKACNSFFSFALDVQTNEARIRAQKEVWASVTFVLFLRGQIQKTGLLYLWNEQVASECQIRMMWMDRLMEGQ